MPTSEQLIPDGRDPNVGVGSNGHAVAVWVDGVAWRPPGATWSTPIGLPDSEGYVWEPDIAVDDQGNAVAVWADRRPDSQGGGDRPFGAALSGGSWSAVKELAPSLHDDDGIPTRLPRVVLDGKGNATAAWAEDFAGSNTRIQVASLPKGGDWNAPTSVTDPSYDADSPDLAVDSKGNLAMAWIRHYAQGERSRVQAALRRPGGAWGKVVTLSRPNAEVDSVRVAMGPGKRTVVVWERESKSDFRDRVQAAVQRKRGGWGKPTTLSSGGRHATDPKVVVRPDGSAIAAWNWWPSSRGCSSATRLPAGRWRKSARSTITRGDCFSPDLAVNRRNEVVAVWVADDDLQAARLSPKRQQWDRPVVLGGGLFEESRIDPRVALGPDGAMVVAWEELDRTNEDIDHSAERAGSVVAAFPRIRG